MLDKPPCFLNRERTAWKSSSPREGDSSSERDSQCRRRVWSNLALEPLSLVWIPLALVSSGLYDSAIIGADVLAKFAIRIAAAFNQHPTLPCDVQGHRVLNAVMTEQHNYALRGSVQLLMGAARFGLVSDLDKYVALRQHLRGLGYVACVQPPGGASDNATAFIAAKAGDGLERNVVHVGKKVLEQYMLVVGRRYVYCKTLLLVAARGSRDGCCPVVVDAAQCNWFCGPGRAVQSDCRISCWL